MDVRNVVIQDDGEYSIKVIRSDFSHFIESQVILQLAKPKHQFDQLLKQVYMDQARCQQFSNSKLLVSMVFF